MDNDSNLRVPDNKILIIDDEPKVVESICDALEKESYNIISANNGRDGLALLEKEKPILVILDLKMPIMDGVEFLDNINLSDTDPYSVIVLTGHGEESDIKKCFRLGINIFLRKPFNIYELRGLIKHSIDFKNLQKKLTRKIEDHAETEGKIKTLSVAVEQSTNIVMVTDANGNIEHVNPRFSQITGYHEEEVIGKNPRLLKSGNQPRGVYDELWSAITSGKKWHGAFKNKRKDGKPYCEEAFISPVINAQGEITHFVKDAENISSAK